MLNGIGTLDNLLIGSWTSRNWPRWIGLWLAGVVVVAAFSFVLLFVPGALWLFGTQAYDSVTGAVVGAGMKLSEVTGAAVLDGEINGLILLVVAPLLMIVQELLGDFKHVATPPASTPVPFVGD